MHVIIFTTPVIFHNLPANKNIMGFIMHNIISKFSAQHLHTMAILPKKTALKLAGMLVVGVLATPLMAADQFVNILTGGTSGVYYPLGVALGKIYNDKIPNVKTQVQATKASVENLKLLNDGKGEIAFTLGDSLKLGWNGDADSGFTSKLTKLRGIGAIYSNYIQVVANGESGIKNFADLRGKKMSVGAPKSGTELNAREIFEAEGMTYKDLARVEYLAFGESVDLMKNRQIDATLQSAGLGVGSIKDMAASLPITIVAIPEPIVKKIGAPYIPAVIPANSYKGQEKDVPTAKILNYLVTNEMVSDELAYQMTKQLFESLPDLVAAHNAANEIQLKNALDGMPIPLHNGAIKYYKEKGLIK